MARVDISYLVVPTDNADEAQSLANYLNEHGICAFAQDGNEVNIPRENAGTVGVVDTLLVTWRMYWEYSGCSLLGLLCFTKE